MDWVMNIQTKIKKIPQSPGVYFFHNKRGKIIYVGKSAYLRRRISSYFSGREKLAYQKDRMIDEIAKIDFIETDSEINALFLESELIKRYKPKYNIDWKDDKNYLYARITIKDKFPTIELVRTPADDKSRYFGPFVDSGALKKVLKMIRKVFPYSTCRPDTGKACFWYHIGLCPGVCVGRIRPEDYKKNIRNIIAFFEGKNEKIIAGLKKQMGTLSGNKEFEKAASLRDKIRSLERIKSTDVFGKTEEERIKSDVALAELVKNLNLEKIPRKIECYDVSNIMGTAATGSMTIFFDGIPKKDHYRRFKIKLVKGIDDYAMISEILLRRFSLSDKKDDSAFEILPDLIIIDGGKGQVSAAKSVLEKYGLEIPLIGIAKRLEEIIEIKDGKFNTKRLRADSPALHLLQRIRDEAHRFAITYHHGLRGKGLAHSVLDEIPGIGEETKKVILKEFGSLDEIKKAREHTVAKIVGPKKAKVIKKYL